MAKKGNSKLGLIAVAIAAISAIVAVIMFAAPMAIFNKGTSLESSASGFQFAFGFSQKIWGPIAVEYKAAPLVMVGFFLMIAAVLFAVVCALPQLAKFRKLSAIIGAALLITAAVFMFVSKANWAVAQGLDAEDAKNISYGFGAIASAVLCILGGLGFGGVVILG